MDQYSVKITAQALAEVTIQFLVSERDWLVANKPDEKEDIQILEKAFELLKDYYT